jgi:hypothetical protein
MNSLSATQAISPAIERTKQFLFRPFRLGRFLKLTLVALLTEGGMASCNFNNHFPSGTNGVPGHPIPPIHIPHMPWSAAAVVIAVVAVVALIVIPVVILISYLVIRLRFSFFDCVLHMQDRIAPGWNRYHRQAMRYLGMSLCIGAVFLLVAGIAGYSIYDHSKSLIDALFTDDRPPFADFLPLIGVVGLLVLLFGIVGSFVEIAMNYFVLPHIALEDASIADALSDVWGDIEIEPWQYLFFVLMRFLLTVAATIIGFVVLLVPFLILGGIGAVLVILLKASSTGLAVLLGVPAGILLLGLLFVAFIAVSGTIGTFRRNYALLFYGGRYPPLGEILQPSLPPAPYPSWTPGPASGSAPGAHGVSGGD